MSKAPQTSVNGLSGHVLCAAPTCKIPFRPLKKSQRFHSPECKVQYHTLAYRLGQKEMERATIHSARLETSERLQRVLEVLSDGKPHTTREIIMAADVCAVNTIVSELRDNGCSIDCAPVKGKRGVYAYTLKGERA